jgi:hypothetical protein
MGQNSVLTSLLQFAINAATIERSGCEEKEYALEGWSREQ